MATISSASLKEQLLWRYAVKKFDPQKKIDETTWKVLEDSLVYSPSSYGLQPWKFIVVTDPKVKADLKPLSWNQSQVTDCSHYVIFATLIDVKESHVDAWVNRMADVKGIDVATLKGFRDMMVKDFVTGARHSWVAEWTSRQAYIALGTLMTAASMVGVDSCPFEGIQNEKYDEYFHMKEKGYRIVCSCPLGYRASDDKYAAAPKIRFPHEQIIERY